MLVGFLFDLLKQFLDKWPDWNLTDIQNFLLENDVAHHIQISVPYCCLAINLYCLTDIFLKYLGKEQ